MKKKIPFMNTNQLWGPFHEGIARKTKIRDYKQIWETVRFVVGSRIHNPTIKQFDYFKTL